MYTTGKTTQEKAKEAYQLVIMDKPMWQRAMGHQVVRASTFDNRSKRTRTRGDSFRKAVQDQY
jgi:hypothetical protein